MSTADRSGTAARVRRAVRLAAERLHRATALHVLAPLIGQTCAVCGRKTILRRRGKVPSDLAKAWELSPPWIDWFTEREFRYCLGCGSSERVRHFAAVLVRELGSRCGASARSVDELCRLPAVRELDVAEINMVGALHPFLARLPKLRYSEYGSTDAAVQHEDILALSYGPNCFDTVLTSETLEHVPNFEMALEEIRRVLKPGGLHLFTIPVVWDHQTRQRARIEGGVVRHLLPPSYHGDATAQASDYLVFYEFGSDVVERVKAAGFEVRVDRHDRNPAMTVFITEKR